MPIPDGKPQAGRLPSLTGMRFVAAFLVFALHATQAQFIGGSAGKTLADVFARSGFYGVSFFFVLSGFVLTWSARPGDRAKDIWRRRLVKIYPNHLATTVLAALLMLVASFPLSVKAVFANIFLVQSWFPSIEISRSMNQVSWSLSCELFFYLSFPLLLRMLNRVPVSRLWVLAAALIALIWIVPVVAQHAIGGTPLPYFADGKLSYEQIWFAYLFPPVRVLEFVLGMVSARLVMAGAWPRIGLLPTGLFAVVGYVVYLKVPYLFGVGGTAALWLTPLIAAGALADTRGTVSPFRGRILGHLGERSFAFYMAHGLVVAYAGQWIVGTHPLSNTAGIALLVTVFALSLALADVLYTRLEQPITRRFSRPASRRHPEPAVTGEFVNVG